MFFFVYAVAPRSGRDRRPSGYNVSVISLAFAFCIPSIPRVDLLNSVGNSEHDLMTHALLNIAECPRQLPVPAAFLETCARRVMCAQVRGVVRSGRKRLYFTLERRSFRTLLTPRLMCARDTRHTAHRALCLSGH